MRASRVRFAEAAAAVPRAWLEQQQPPHPSSLLKLGDDEEKLFGLFSLPGNRYTSINIYIYIYKRLVVILSNYTSLLPFFGPRARQQSLLSPRPCPTQNSRAKWSQYHHHHRRRTSPFTSPPPHHHQDFESPCRSDLSRPTTFSFLFLFSSLRPWYLFTCREG